MSVVLVDYHKGNIRSVERGLQAAGAEVMVSDHPADVRAADAVVLPGVGAFSDAAATLEELGLAAALRDACAAGVPFLGICLGMHLMFAGGEEHASADAPAPGLGLLPGVVGRVPAVDDAGRAFKVPHVGWNSVELVPGAPSLPQALFEGIRDGEFFYFTHSFQAPQTPATVACTCHAQSFPSAVAVPGNPQFGVQFHPEKSSDAGARLLANFVRLAARDRGTGITSGF
ncbi:imidazole glycerol phosphate synthase subunit HisH [Parvibacter caecicola]|uniref:Imidazole glycerol phosphate synthase subunit HisH n=1 Tax=Parvibacter caecicola TaxID=747645 RepID=A0A4T9T668_9ACTN|nr:imidazole glycerol phosphate synthase subunit HisH [Parvibacter caecicola]TJW09798.1 imidazole glycerol phosphate synthase subunit HisH [Parvibacter caecicola]